MKKILIATILGTVTLYIWSIFSWMVLPWHSIQLGNLPGGEAVIEALPNEKITNGVYFFPSPYDDDGNLLTGEPLETVTKRLEQGPNINFMVINAKGNKMMTSGQFILTFIYHVVTVLIFVLISFPLSKEKAWSPLLVAVGMGLFAAILGPLNSLNWWHFPFYYSMVNAADLVFSWLLVGLATMWITRSSTR